MHNPKEKNEVHLRIPCGHSWDLSCFSWLFCPSGWRLLALLSSRCSGLSWDVFSAWFLHSSPEQGFLLKALSWVAGHRRVGGNSTHATGLSLQSIFCQAVDGLNKLNKSQLWWQNQNADSREGIHFSPQGISVKCLIDLVSQKHAVHSQGMSSMSGVKHATQKWQGLGDNKPFLIIHGGGKIVISWLNDTGSWVLFHLGSQSCPSNVCISQLNLQCTPNPDKMSTMDYLSV